MATSNFYFLTLDIETSKKMEYDEKLEKDMPTSVWLSYGVCMLCDIKGKTVKKVRFREWEELKRFFSYLEKGFNKKLLCFVHNLSYEFDFLIKNLSKPKKFLCNSTHSVICATLEDFDIEFRCTYQLSKMSLAKLGEIYKLPKLDSDYRDVYPDDEVTEDEWLYCERDNEIVKVYIIDEVKNYRMLCYLPYTSTGKVRVELKRRLKEYENTEWDLMPNEDCYEALSKTFRGAITMSNPRFTNKVINATVKSFDEKSKYPGVMLTEQFPYTIERTLNFDNNTYKNYKFWIARVRLVNVTTKFEWGVISANTCEDYDILASDTFNGKILNSPWVELYITNIDLDMFNKVYDISAVEFIEFYPCKTFDYLPEPFIELIKSFAKPKYEIGKELEVLREECGEDSEIYSEKYKEYMESKSKLNGIYGMMVQKLTQQEFYIDENFLWHEKDNSYKKIEGKHLKRNFLFGIYITAYSRYDLVSNIIENCPENFVYCDTDSIKFIDIGKEFVDVNKPIPSRFNDCYYLKGFNQFEEEKPYSKFLTYGAKKYAYEKKGVFGFTVAGLPKKTQISSLDEFKLGAVFKNCKLAKRYIYNDVVNDVDIETGEIFNTGECENIISKGGVALFEVDYKLNMTSIDKLYVERNKIRWERKNIQQNIII